MASAPQARMSDLPDEMLACIFSFLPVADLARCAAACGRWHAIVTGCPRLWRGEGKLYRSDRDPAHCDETRAVLRALPPFHKVTIESATAFAVSVSYPLLVLEVRYISVMNDFPILRCDYLSTRLDIAGDILTYQSTVDFGRLQRMRILRMWNLNFWAPRVYSVDYVIRRALLLCQNLRHLSLRTDFVAAEYLEAEDGLGRLQSLEISSPGIRKLSFLRMCSGVLEGLQLVSCRGLWSREFARIGLLGNLRRLWLSDCRFSEGDMLEGLAGLASLESLQLHCCSPIRDLSVLRRCGRLRDLRITNTSVSDASLSPAQGDLPLTGLVVPTDADDLLVRVVGVVVTADNLPDALSTLEEMGLPWDCLDYLGALLPCTQLQYLCCEFTRGPDELQELNVRVRITINSSA